MRFGVGQTYREDRDALMPATKRFFAGGANTLRGFGLDEASPKVPLGNPIGDNVLSHVNFELRFPIVGNIGGVVFSDNTTVYRRLEVIDLLNWRYNMGFGIRSTPLSVYSGWTMASNWIDGSQSPPAAGTSPWGRPFEMKAERRWASLVGAGILTVSLNAAQELVDRIVAIVDRDVITLSEAEQAQALQSRQQGEASELRLIVERQIEATLIGREVSAIWTLPSSPRWWTRPSIDCARAFHPRRISRKSSPSTDSPRTSFALGFGNQLSVNRYLERRFRALTYVTDEEVERYYRESLAPTLSPDRLPPLEEVSEQIRQILEERELNDRVERWISSLKSEARIRRYVW